MGQITTGIRSTLAHPGIYRLVQNILGAHKGRTEFVQDFIRPVAGNLILDIGCGPAEIIDYLPKVQYWGFDISPEYISQAKGRHKEGTHFFQKEFARKDVESLPKFDIALAIGVLHHLDDESSRQLFELLHESLKPGGRVVTIDPCYEDGQNPLAKFLISHDRGQNVRTRCEYEALAPKLFSHRHAEVRHRAWIPYTHCFMECTRT